MREIKFRAWDKLGDDEGNPCMRSWDQLLRDKYSNSADSIFNDKMLILMQYTGLKDKNGVEMYKWDVCRFRDLCNGDPNEIIHGCIIWDQSRAGFVLRDVKENHKGGYFTTSWDFAVDIEVIGNVCENPELVDPSCRHFSEHADDS